MKLTRKTKLGLFRAINESGIPLIPQTEELRSLSFLDKIWDLRLMPSEDSRCKDAYDDIAQHTIRNDDWDDEYLLIDRLNLLEDDVLFIRFIEATVNDTQSKSDEERKNLLNIINPFLSNVNYKLVIDRFDSKESPVYRLKKIDPKNTSTNILDNKIPFFVEKEPMGRSCDKGSHNQPLETPCFVLAQDDWNDYSKRTTFDLFFYKDRSDCQRIGVIKITDGKSENTGEVLEEKFMMLSSDFASLGQSSGFYIRLKEITKDRFKSVLLALRDTAFFSEIHDIFYNNSFFQDSLIRGDEAERLQREIKHKIAGYDMEHLYNFTYKFQAKFAEESVDIKFDFDGMGDVPNRIFVIIGKNGTGKTQLMTSLPISISTQKNDLFSPRIPLFSKVIAVSYSMFDKFEIPEKTLEFNYIYCGLFKEINGIRENMTESDHRMQFDESWKKIRHIERMQKWRDTLLNFLDEEVIDAFIIPDGENKEDFTVDIEAFDRVKKKLSSGQGIMLYILTGVVANIRYDSLILFDEPETHLHPNAVNQLMNIIYDLVNKFKSYCIITTHSPLIIQEVLAKNVFVIERDGTLSTIRKIGIETFGENISTIINEVFGNNQIPKQYKKIIEKLIERHGTYKEVVNSLESNGLSLSLNARLYIKSKL